MLYFSRFINENSDLLFGPVVHNCFLFRLHLKCKFLITNARLGSRWNWRQHTPFVRRAPNTKCHSFLAFFFNIWNCTLFYNSYYFRRRSILYACCANMQFLYTSSRWPITMCRNMTKHTVWNTVSHNPMHSTSIPSVTNYLFFFYSLFDQTATRLTFLYIIE